MSFINQQQVYNILSDLKYKNGSSLISYLSDIIIKEVNGKYNIAFAVNVVEHSLIEAEELRKIAIYKLESLPLVGNITIALTREIEYSSASNSHPNKVPKQQPQNANIKTTIQKRSIEGVKKVILVTAGKGGVGKSTITAILAEELTVLNMKIGIVDADIYGPSIAKIFAITQKPVVENNKFIPIVVHGIQIMSIGCLIDENQVIPWRGPMASKAIHQLLSLTAWDNLDYLLVDMPPGTSDIHLSILQSYQIDGAVVVTTPQQISEIDVDKSIQLYQKFNVPLTGIIENMSYFIDSAGQKIKIFPGKSASNLAKKYQTSIIGELAIIPKIAENCDYGLNLQGLVKSSLNLKALSSKS